MVSQPPPSVASDRAEWPFSSMLLIGTFGHSHTPASRRYHLEAAIAVAILLVGALIANALAPALGIRPMLFRGILASTVFVFLGAALWRYVGSLDELSRRLQLEAMAISYICAIALFVVCDTVAGAGGWTVRPVYFVALELLRGASLALLARNYR
jgi:hypothetical protein